MAPSGLHYEYLQCSYDSWCGQFQNNIHQHVIIPVPENVASYLMSDLMVLPKNSGFIRQNMTERNDMWSNTEEELEEPEFHEFGEKLVKAIQDLGGKVFIKLNWSAPKDASWITSTRSLCCSDPADIYLLLKSSTCISEDLSLLTRVSESKGEVPCCLILKKWEEIHPGTEYRCFVINRSLAGICQRDTASFFKYIGDNKEAISEFITNFFLNHVKPKFPLDNYTFDVVFALGMKIILVDFGVLNQGTNCLLFSWKELAKRKVVECSELEKNSSNREEDHLPAGEKVTVSEERPHIKPEFRYIDEFTNVTQNQCKHYGIPVDVMHFCSGKKNVADFIQEEILNNQL